MAALALAACLALLACGPAARAARLQTWELDEAAGEQQRGQRLGEASGGNASLEALLRLLPDGLSGDVPGVALKSLNLGELHPKPCADIVVFRVGDKVRVRGSESGRWLDAVVTSVSPLEAKESDYDWRNPKEWRFIEHAKARPKGGRLDIDEETHYRLFMSVVAGKFGDDGEDESFYRGDFFTTPSRADTLRCYYAQLLRDSAEIAAQRGDRGQVLKEGFLALARTVESSSLVTPSRTGAQEAVIRNMASLMHRVRSLSVGDWTLFPCGWTGHAVYCEIAREGGSDGARLYTLSIFNSGDGAGFHYSISHDGFARKYSPTLIYSSVPEDVLLHPTQVRLIIEMGSTYTSIDGGKVTSSPESMYETALGRLDPWLDEVRSTTVMMDSQAGGTCMVTGLHHMVHFKLRERIPPDEQEDVGRIIEHALQLSALTWFSREALKKRVEDVLPSLEDFKDGDENGPLPIPAASFYQLARRKNLLETAARQVLMHDENDSLTNRVAKPFFEWIRRDPTPVPRDLHDTFGAGEAASQSFEETSFEQPLIERGTNVPASERTCSFFPSALTPELRAAPEKQLQAIAEMSLDVIDRCFGETYVDWLAGRLLALNFEQLPSGQQRWLSSTFFQLADQVRRFGATQPAADHILALRKLILAYHEAAASADKLRLRTELHGAPSLEQFSTLSLQMEPVETAQNLLYGSMGQIPLPEPHGEEYLYVVAAAEKEEAESTPRNKLKMLCSAYLHMPTSGVQLKNMEGTERGPDGNVGKKLSESWQKTSTNWNFKSAERYVIDFLGQAKGQRGFRLAGTCDVCRSVSQCVDEPARAAACVLAQKMKIEPVGISDDFFVMRRMLAEFHLLEHAVAPRYGGFQLADAQPIEKDESTKINGVTTRKHYVGYEWCTVPRGDEEYRLLVEDRELAQAAQPARHRARSRLRIALDGADEKAVAQFLFRDDRPAKWQQWDKFPLAHDGDNAVVLYDLEKYGTSEELSPLQRTLFEVGVHSTLAQEQWLGYLQEHRLCFMNKLCRVATDAILFSDKFSPARCTSGPDTTRGFQEATLGILDVHANALEIGEPSISRLLAISHTKITGHRLRSRLGIQARAQEVLHDLHISRAGWHAQVSQSHDETATGKLQRLTYALACMEVLVLLDLRGSDVSHGFTSQETRDLNECAALFFYATAFHLDDLDPAAMHQAARAHGSYVSAADRHMCELIGGDYKQREFPLLQCGSKLVNMMSGVLVNTGVLTVEFHNLPSAVREQAFAHALVRMQVAAMGYVSDETLRVVTASGDTYFVTQRVAGTGTERWKAKVLIHREPASGSHLDGRRLQLVEPCNWHRSFERSGTWGKNTTVTTDLRTILLGAGDAKNAFCWADPNNEQIQVTHVGATGLDRMVAALKITGDKLDVTVMQETPYLPAYLVGKSGLTMTFASPWVQDKIWSKKRNAEGIMDMTGVFTRFHEGRPPLILNTPTWLFSSGGDGAVVFAGVRSEDGPVTLKCQGETRPTCTIVFKSKVYAVVNVHEYPATHRYLLEYGLPHLLLKPSDPKQASTLSLLLPLPSPQKSTGGSTGRAEKVWRLPVRKAAIFEFENDDSGAPTGMLLTKTREDRLALALMMTRVKDRDYAFRYMASVYHLMPWTEEELFFLNEFAAMSAALRDPVTSYLRMFAVKLIRDECLRFPVTGCDHRLGLDSEDWMKAAQKSMDLALQTKHLVPVYRIAEMRTLTLTRFFSQSDLEADPDGLRGWMLGATGPKVDLVPKRQAYPTKTGARAGADLLLASDGMYRYCRSCSWENVYPENVLENVESIQGHYQDIKRQLKSASGLVHLFCWLQPVLPGSNIELKADEHERKSQTVDYQVALLLHIYRTRKQIPGGELDQLKPLAEAWMFQEKLDHTCKNCGVLHGMLQLMASARASDEIEPLEAMVRNIGPGGYYFGYPRRSSFFEPARCCHGAGAMPGRVASWAQAVVQGRPLRKEHPYRFKPLPSAPLFAEVGAASLPDTATECSEGNWLFASSTKQLMKAMLTSAFRRAPIQSGIHLTLPPEGSTQERADLLVGLYVAGGHYASVFPGVDSSKLHCEVHRYLMSQTEESQKRKGLKRNWLLKDFPSVARAAMLVFEYRTGFAIRAAQVQQLRDLLLAEPSQPRIQQIMMGGGKTSVYSPVLLHTVGGLGAFMSPSSVFNQNAKDLTIKTDTIFGQRGFGLSCHRTTGQQKLATLRWVLSQVEEGARLRKYVLMLPKTLQCFQNLLMMNMGAPEKYAVISRILQLLRAESTAIIDEIDTVFDPNTEVNFPLSGEDTTKDLPAVHFLTVFFTLPAWPGEDVKLRQSTYDNEIKPSLVTQLLAKLGTDGDGGLPFTLIATNQERVSRISKDLRSCGRQFLTGELQPGQHTDSKGSDCAGNRNMQIVHMFVQDIAPQVIKFRRNVDYGRSHKNPEQAFVIPYAFANKPVEGSKFSNYLLSVGLSFQYWFLGGLTQDIFALFIKELRKIKVRRGKGMLQMMYDHTEEQLPDLPQIPSEELANGQKLVPRDITRDATTIIGVLGRFVVPRVTVSASQVTNYALNMDNSMKRFIGFSGTISSSSIFPSRAKVVGDTTVESRLRERTVDNAMPREHIFQINPADENLVGTLTSGAKFEHTNALLDCGAFLRDYKNFEVAQSVLRVRPDVSAVLYYDDIENRIYALHRNGKRLLSSKTELVLTQWNLEYKDVFLYLDQQHTVGTDMRLADSAVAALTINRKTNLEALMQAIMRMRNYQGIQYNNGNLQDVVFVFKDQKPASLAELWEDARANTNKLVESLKPTIDRRKANAVYRRFYLDKQPAPTEDRTRAYAEMVFQRTHDFLDPADPSEIGSEFEAIDATMPFSLASGETQELRSATAEAVASASADRGTGGGPSTEEELEMELEQEAELQVERLRNDENLNEDSFTNDPVQWPPMYAFCDEAAVTAAAVDSPIRDPSLHTCTPVSSWLADDTSGIDSPVAASLAFTLVRPAPLFNADYSKEGEWFEELKELKGRERKAELLRRMQLFQDPWALPHSDEADPAPWLNSSGRLISDYRKNVRSVAFVVDTENPARFKFILMTSTEAQKMRKFCSSATKYDGQMPDMWQRFHWSDDLFKDAKKTAECEDVQRATYSPKKIMGYRHDIWQQLALHQTWETDSPALGNPEAVKEYSSLDSFFRSYWSTRHCAVFTPTALPKDFLPVLMPDGVASRLGGAGRSRLTRALVEVLMLAGSEEVLEREEFKPEFFQRMQAVGFREKFRAVREKMGEPIDAADLAYIRERGVKCEKTCVKSNGSPDYRFGTTTENDEVVLTCACR